MREFLAKLTCLIAAITIMEVPTVILQSYAWTTMLSDRIPEQGLSQAFASTFDGGHPCEHCLTAEKIQTDRQESDESTPAQQFQLGNLKLTEYSNHDIVLPPPPTASLVLHSDDVASYVRSIYPSVPTPPPRT